MLSCGGHNHYYIPPCRTSAYLKMCRLIESTLLGGNVGLFQMTTLAKLVGMYVSHGESGCCSSWPARMRGAYDGSNWPGSTDSMPVLEIGEVSRNISAMHPLWEGKARCQMEIKAYCMPCSAARFKKAALKKTKIGSSHYWKQLRKLFRLGWS